jgi:hypothetical protein
MNQCIRLTLRLFSFSQPESKENLIQAASSIINTIGNIQQVKTLLLHTLSQYFFHYFSSFSCRLA